jgi:hypothetical protein
MKTLAVIKAALLVAVVLPIALAATLVALTSDAPAAARRAGPRTPAVGSASGVVQIAGEDVIVSVLVRASDASRASTEARAALKRNYPHAALASVLNTKARGGNTGFTVNGLVWDTLPVPVNYNDAGAPVAGALADLTAAMTTWDDVPTSSFAFAYAGDTDRCPSLIDECHASDQFDGHNDVGWVDLVDPNVLAVTFWGTKTREFDTAMNIHPPNFSWATGCPPSQAYSYSVQSVFTHELGRALGLGTSKDPSSIMYEPYQGHCTLGTDDVLGVSALYPEP